MILSIFIIYHFAIYDIADLGVHSQTPMYNNTEFVPIFGTKQGVSDD